MLILEIILAGLALLLLFPTTILFAEVVLAKNPTHSVPEPGGRPRLAIVMPAHDEAAGIAATLRSIIPQLTNADRLLVVADNCSDETAATAAAEGAEVIERVHSSNRGKGYALDFGIQHLHADPPAVVFVIDADCQMTSGSIDRLARVCGRTARPVQALYLMRAKQQAGLKMRIAEFAWLIKNQVRPLGLLRLGLPCQLMGTGMAFPWGCISSARLATGHIVEDLKLGIDLARAGTPAMFCPAALVTSEFPLSNEGIAGQRTRWEHGHLGTILKDAPALLGESLFPPNPRLIALALDLCVPPLALLALLVTSVWFATAIFYGVARMPLPLYIATVTAVLFALAVMLSWGRFGRRIVSLGNLAMAGVYALWKIPMYAKFLVARQRSWVRSKRDEDGP